MAREVDAEIVVVGGGPAGSSLAAALAIGGRQVVLLDKASFPRHKACSEYINAGAVQLLDEMGILDEVMRAGAHRMDAMIVNAPNGHRFVANFAKAESGRAALGLSRFRLDHLLLERAKDAGVDVRERTHVHGVQQRDGCVVGVDATIAASRVEIRAPMVIGADGRHSAVSRALGLDSRVRWPNKTGLVAHYRGVSGLHRFGEMHVGRHVYSGLAPLEDGLTNVAVVANADEVHARVGTTAEFFENAIHGIPEIARKLIGAERVGTIRGVGSMAHRARRTVGDGFLLVGDAASFLDPFTGDGIYDALQAAKLAAPVVLAALSARDVSAKALEPYRTARRRTFTAKREVCWIVQGFVNAPPLMNYVTTRLSHREELALTMSSVLGNVRPASDALSPMFLARLLRP
jgi:geranylgeranyl reductase family protein